MNPTNNSVENDSKRLKRKRFLNEIEEILRGCEEDGITLIPPFRPKALNGWERAAMKLTDRVGSWPFVIAMAIIILMWFSWNGHPFLSDLHFDKFPFIFLNLALSAIAGFQAPIILMAQNAQYHRDSQRDAYYHEIQVVMEAELRAAYNRLTNIEIDLAVATEEMNYVQENIRRELKDLSDKCEHLVDGTAEYKNRVDGVLDTLKTIQTNVDTISGEHIKIIRDMFETIKSSKEMKDERRDPGKHSAPGTGSRD